MAIPVTLDDDVSLPRSFDSFERRVDFVDPDGEVQPTSIRRT